MPDQEKVSGLPKLSVPISAYDVFGYFVPAISMSIAVYAFEYFGSLTRTYDNLGTGFRPLFLTLLRLVPTIPEQPSVIISALFLVSLVCVMYALGHVIASVSSLFIDRIFVFRGLGYPYERILRVPNEQGKEEPPADQILRNSIVASFCYVNLSLLLLYVAAFLIVPLKPECVFFIQVLCAVLLSIFAVPAVTLFAYELCAVSQGKHLKERYPCYLKWVNLVVGLPRLVALLLSRLMHRKRQLPASLVPSYRKQFELEFGISEQDAQTCNYWFCEMYIADNAPAMHRKLMMWLQLYSFARNLSAAFYLAFAYCSVLLALNYEIFQLQPAARGIHLLAIIPLCYFAAAFFMLVRYYYLYSVYYSAYLFRAFLYAKRPGAIPS